MKLGEDVILTSLRQSGASESVTVCYQFKYLLLTVHMRSFVCVCERERVTAQNRE